MIRVTSRQCRQSRALLKWNMQDLITRCRILTLRRLEEFERGADRLRAPECKEVFEIFTKAGLVFKGENEVKFARRPGEADTNGATHAGGGGAAIAARVDVTDEIMNQSMEDSGDERDSRERDLLKRRIDTF